MLRISTIYSRRAIFQLILRIAAFANLAFIHLNRSADPSSCRPRRRIRRKYALASERRARPRRYLPAADWRRRI